MSAEATCRCICHAFGDERLYCEHRGCCNAWAKGYRDASEDSRAIAGICMTCGVTVSHRPGKPGEYDHTCPSRSRAPSPPETPAPDADRCDCDGQKGQGCTICASPASAPTDPDALVDPLFRYGAGVPLVPASAPRETPATLESAARAVLKAAEGFRLPYRHDLWMRLIDLRNALPPEASASAPSRGNPPPCTGRTAVWCPVHGDCRCPTDDDGTRTLDGVGCPLHAWDSMHGEPAPASSSTDPATKEQS